MHKGLHRLEIRPKIYRPTNKNAIIAKVRCPQTLEIKGRNLLHARCWGNLPLNGELDVLPRLGCSNLDRHHIWARFGASRFGWGWGLTCLHRAKFHWHCILVSLGVGGDVWRLHGASGFHWCGPHPLGSGSLWPETGWVAQRHGLTRLRYQLSHGLHCTVALQHSHGQLHGQLLRWIQRLKSSLEQWSRRHCWHCHHFWTSKDLWIFGRFGSIWSGVAATSQHYTLDLKIGRSSLYPMTKTPTNMQHTRSTHLAGTHLAQTPHCTSGGFGGKHPQKPPPDLFGVSHGPIKNRISSNSTSQTSNKHLQPKTNISNKNPTNISKNGRFSYGMSFAESHVPVSRVLRPPVVPAALGGAVPTTGGSRHHWWPP